LAEFSLAKFSALFGLSKVKSASIIAFRMEIIHPQQHYSNQMISSDKQQVPSLQSNNSSLIPNERTITISNAYSPTVEQPERMSLMSLETITGTLLELMEACMNDIPDSEWLPQWQELAKRFAFQSNPALQPRAMEERTDRSD
jgi:neurofibromin 1